MKMTDLRAKARAIFGNAIAEPMPNQPNGAKALQQRANARPIPTYKVGGVVKKNDGGLLKKPIRGKKISVPLEDEKLQTRRDFAKPLPKKQPKIVDFEPRQPKTGRAPANAPKPPEMTRGPDITVRGNPPTKPGREEAMMEARRAAEQEKNRLRDRRSPEESDVLIATRRGQQMLEIQKRREMAEEAARRKKQEAADRLLGVRMKNGGKMPDLTGDGKVTRADVLKGRGVEGFQKGGKVQTSSDTARKLATEMGGMKKGGKAKDGLAVMIAIGKPMKKPAKKMGGGMMYAEGGKPEKLAVGGAGKTRKGMAPIKKAQGGAAKVRKGMMSETGDIKQVVKPKKGLGGM